MKHGPAHAKPASKTARRPSAPPPLKQEAARLLHDRRQLPIWPHLAAIRHHLRQRHVLLLVGETGSGKSTQVPQCLVREPWCQRQAVMVKRRAAGSGPSEAKPENDEEEEEEEDEEISVGGCIAITQPRRVAAISLARRVAAEMGTPLGSASAASQVGYSVRFDRSTSASTRIKFVTDGMLLQELLRDPWLRAYSAVIVDEIHERGVNVDLVVGFLRRLLAGGWECRGGIPLKVVVMSATADVAKLQRFFGAPDTVTPTVDGSTGDARDEQAAAAADDVRRTVGVHTVPGRQYSVQIIYTPEPVPDLIEATLHKVFEIHYGEPLPGDVLVFLTGQDDIESLATLIAELAAEMGPEIPKLLVLPLFAALPQSEQQRVFQPAPHAHTRKIILSTNIAETSVTVPGIRYVIDSGKAKMKHFRTRLGLDSLLPRPISQSSAQQRAGRAGREAPGKCYRLYTAAAFQQLPAATAPEMLRCDLAPGLLMLKARGVADLAAFPFLDRPPRDALAHGLMQLYTLGALTADGAISALGRQMAALPLAPGLSRVVLAAAAPGTDCLLEVIDIIACLTVEHVFVPVHHASDERRAEADAARKRLTRREGDHLTLLNTVQQYTAAAAAAAPVDRREWARRHFVSHRSMQAVMDVQKQLRAICRRHGLFSSSSSSVSTPSTTDPARAALILQCFLTGFAAHTARPSPDGAGGGTGGGAGYRTVVGGHPIAIHPASGLHGVAGRRLEAIMYHEYVFTNRGYAKCVSAVQLDWVESAFGVRESLGG
ncbi:MAG: putative ATP-dependent RNA helicase dhr2 [Phylliscum demangeonii]|nr:MAG: putative ATP-dependent RNA helicase dhr2 [Phylliscum demangeonii]